MYLDDDDLDLVHDELAHLGDVAWFETEGPGRWRAQRLPLPNAVGNYLLWHVPSGPLPRVWYAGSADAGDWIEDPWSGWNEPARTDTVQPYFGPIGSRRTIGLQLCTRLPPNERHPERLGMSGIGWAGDLWSKSDREPPGAASTWRWWRALP
jgi:hypothetical protein